ncbi:MAG: FAD-dependent oxidoreductase [Bacteroidota bacterium]|nr:FAD-dependent oxidoreductase [Bacteroidota bacterium]
MVEQVNTRETSCLVVGAGIAGLMAARELQRQGVPVITVDKSRGVGGRMATRRFAGGVFDHGTQYFAPSSAWFQSRIAEWLDEDITREWFRVRAYEIDPRFISSARYRGHPAMTAVPKHLATGMDVHTATRVTSLREEDGHWVANTDTGVRYRARSCILTPPVPQIRALLTDSGLTPDARTQAVLAGRAYEPCIAVLAVCDDAPDLPDNGVLEFERGNLRRIIDNSRKGISPDVHAITIHASGAFSTVHFDDDDAETGRRILEETQLILRVAVREHQVHRWRYSQVLEPHPEPALPLFTQPPLAVAGDAFGLNGVEGAARSGMEAARLIMRQLS